MRHLTVLLAFFLALAFVAEAAPTISKELIGKWHVSGKASDGPHGEHGMSWSFTYTLNADGTYQLDGYPSLYDSGRVEILEQKKHQYRLRFSSEKDWMGTKGSRETMATIDPKTHTLRMFDTSFRRQE